MPRDRTGLSLDYPIAVQADFDGRYVFETKEISTFHVFP